jgi:hypothetical protein
LPLSSTTLTTTIKSLPIPAYVYIGHPLIIQFFQNGRS